MSKPMKIMITTIVIVFGGIIAFNFFKGFMIKRFFASYEPPAVTVSSVKAIKKSWQPQIPAVGNFVATNGVEVNSQASGNIVKIHFESGQYIAANNPLVDINDNVDQATLKFNQALLVLKEISYKRQTDLYKRGATPISSVDEAKANLQQAQANVERTEAEIRQKHISAPFAGKLGIRQVNLGQYVTPGQTSIVTLQALDPLFLDFYLPEQLFKNLKINQAIQFEVEAFPDIIFEGSITAINSKIDPNTHNILVQAKLPNCPAKALEKLSDSTLIKISNDPDSNKTIVHCDTELNNKNHISHFTFLPGMFASIAVEQQTTQDVVLLPSTAISYSLYGNSVFVIEHDKKKGKKDENGQDKLYVNRVFVTTGEQEGNYTVINKGIEPGQLVVSSGELKLQNGTRVVINNSVELHQDLDVKKIGQ